MEKYLLLFGVFLVTWQIQSAAGFPGRFKNSSTSQEGDTGKNAPTIGDASPEGNSSKESTTDESTTKETTTTVTTTEETTTKTVPDPPPNPVGPFSCNDLKSTDGKDHKFDILRCNSLKSSEKDMMLKPTISNDFDINLFNKFADNLKSIDGVGLELGKTELKKIDIVKLQNFANSKGLKMESNGNLQYLDIRVANPLSKFGDLSVQLNDALVSFLLVPEGGEICGSIEFLKNDMLAVIYVNVTKIDAPIKIPAQPSKLIFSDNPSLETIYLMNLKEIKNVKEWKIVNNALGKMATSRLTNIIGMDRFEVSGNKGLKSLYFPELIHVDVREIIISNNANLKSIIINNPKLTFSENTTIVIRQNHKLTHIHIMVVKLHTIRFEIRGNPSLNVTWLNRLRHDYQGSCEHAGNSCIQRDGECILDKEIQDLSEITDCKYVCGNLTLAENVTGEFDASIDLVDGDIHFANYPWWSIKGTEGKGVLDKKGRVYSNRCDAVGYGGEVIIVGNCETEPPPIETVENITTTTTTRAPQMPETFRPEDYVLEENMKEPATATQSSWLSQSDITAIILVIILGSFFAMLIYLYHCRSDENRQRGALTDGLTRIEDNSLAEIEISAAEMAEPPSKERPKLPPSMSTTSNSAGGIPSTGRSPMPEAVNPANPPVNPSQPNINNKYLLLFGVFLVTWQIQSAAGFPGRFKNSSISREGDAPEESTTETVAKPPSNGAGDDLKSDSPVTEILKSCNSLKSSEKDMMLKPTISNESDINLFNKFADNLKSIDGVGLELGKTELKKIDIVKLQNFANSKGLLIISNQNLKYVDVKVANSMTRVSHLTVRDNPKMISFLLRAHNSELRRDTVFEDNAKLTTILLNVNKIEADIITNGNLKDQSEFTIAGNPSLESLYLRELQSISALKKFEVFNNVRLKTIDAPNFHTIHYTGRFEINRNNNLINIDFPKLVIFGAHQLIISKNAHLKSISMKQLKKRSNRLYTTIFNIRQNPMLTTIDIDMNVLIRMHLHIRGNPNLDKNWLKELRESTKRSNTQIEIQMDGECIFEEKIKDLSVLDDCENIFGNLTLAHDVTGTWNARIDTITGDSDFANFPLWEIKGTINHQGKVYSNRCDGPVNDNVIRVGCTTEPPPSVGSITTTTKTTAPTQVPDTFGTEDYVFEENMKESTATTESLWLSEWETTAIILIIILCSFFASLIYLYHCRGDNNEQRTDVTDGLTRIEGNALTEIEISAVEMAEPSFEKASSPGLPVITGKSNNFEGRNSKASTRAKPAIEAVQPNTRSNK